MATFAQRARSSAADVAMPLLIVLVLLAVAALRGPQLFTPVGLAGAILVAAPLILAAMAITPIALAGRGSVDLSIGPSIGFINVTIVVWLTPNGYDQPWVVISYAVLMGLLWQLFVVFVVLRVRVAPIIVTLAGYMVLSGVNLVILPRPSGLAPNWLSDWGYGTELVSPVLFTLLAAFALWFVFQRSALFAHLRMVGADEKTAYTTGIRTESVRVAAHLVGGVFAGLAAVCLTGLTGSGDPTQGNTLTLQAITALVLGGTSLAGGRGGAFGSVLGAISMFLISYVLSTFNFGSVSGFVTQMAYGLILVATMQIGGLGSRRFGGVTVR